MKIYCWGGGQDYLRSACQAQVPLIPLPINPRNARIVMAEKKTTEEFKETFVLMLGQVPNITAVCRLMGINNSNIAVARKKDESFDKKVLAAIDEGYDMLEEEARRRAVDGVVEPVFYKGEQVVDVRGKPTGIRKYSDQLLIALLKGYRPKKFNPGIKLGMGTGSEKVTMTFNIGGG